MRILHIVPIVSNQAAYGGPVRGTLRQSAEIKDRGHDVYVLGLGDTSVEQETLSIPTRTFRHWDLPIHQFAGAFSFRAFAWFARNVRSFDIVHVHAGRDIWPAALMMLMRRLRVPYLIQTHGMIAPRTGRLLRIFDRTVTAPNLKFARTVLYLTSHEKRDLLAVEPNCRLTNLVNGVDDPSDQPSPSVTEYPWRGVFISRLHARKQPALLAEALTNTSTKASFAYFDFYGPDEGELAKLQEHLTATVRYRGALDYAGVRTVLNDYSVMFLPSLAEPFPNIVLESLAAGILVACSEQCGLAPYIRKYDAGLLFAPSRDGLTNAIERFERMSESERIAMARRGLELVKREFSMTSVGDALLKLYAG